MISQETVNNHGMTARVLLSGFSYHRIADDGISSPGSSPYDPHDHLIDILRYFDNDVVYTNARGKAQLYNWLGQNYPNPFNPWTSIRFSIKDKGFVRLCIYNAVGQLIRLLVAEERPAGMYTEMWDGRANNGEFVSSGVYFYRISTQDFSKTRKLVLIH